MIITEEMKIFMSLESYTFPTFISFSY